MNDKVTLSSGYQMPLLAYGLGTTWRNHANHAKHTCIKSIKLALTAGYRHLDEAEMYHTETACGEAVSEWLSAKEGGKDNVSCRRVKRQRSDLFITSKISHSANEPNGVLHGCKKSLERLGVNYLDLYLIHAPFEDRLLRPLETVWLEMENLVKEGLVRSIGVSNCNIHHLKRILKICTIKPSVNQIECHPYLPQKDLSIFCEKHTIVLVSFSGLTPITDPIASGGPVDNIVKELSVKYQKTDSQILQRWLIEWNKGIVTTSTNSKRIVLPLGIYDFCLTRKERNDIELAGLRKVRRRWFEEWLGKAEEGSTIRSKM